MGDCPIVSQSSDWLPNGAIGWPERAGEVPLLKIRVKSRVRPILGGTFFQLLFICTNFMRPDSPLLIDTADLRHPKCWATSATNSSLALPSIGGDLSCANQMPPLVSSRALTRALGLAFT